MRVPKFVDFYASNKQNLIAWTIGQIVAASYLTYDKGGEPAYFSITFGLITTVLLWKRYKYLKNKRDTEERLRRQEEDARLMAELMRARERELYNPITTGRGFLGNQGRGRGPSPVRRLSIDEIMARGDFRPLGRISEVESQAREAYNRRMAEAMVHNHMSDRERELVESCRPPQPKTSQHVADEISNIRVG